MPAFVIFKEKKKTKNVESEEKKHIKILVYYNIDMVWLCVGGSFIHSLITFFFIKDLKKIPNIFNKLY